ncbi:hypothetical protein L218DRAFT_588815 [Marasmius fiardii PR-910]|nr:hypothetical protein L218DRAFT_588815 [Marasmius fiardii PR-910]
MNASKVTYTERHVNLYHLYKTFSVAQCQENRPFMPLGDLILSSQCERLNKLIYFTPLDTTVAIDFAHLQIDLEAITRQWITQKDSQLDIYIAWYNTKHKTGYPNFKTVICRCVKCRAAVWGACLYVHLCATIVDEESSTYSLEICQSTQSFQSWTFVPVCKEVGTVC